MVVTTGPPGACQQISPVANFTRSALAAGTIWLGLFSSAQALIEGRANILSCFAIAALIRELTLSASQAKLAWLWR
jgi:hypothetical protein